MLEVRDLHCSYGTTQVLKGVDITVNRGEVISILGSSGSGKTTLLRCISFLQKANSGTIRFVLNTQNDKKLPSYNLL